MPKQPRRWNAASDPKPRQPRKPNAASEPYNVKPKRGRMPILPGKPNATTSGLEPEQPASEPKPYNVKPKRGRMPILPGKPNATTSDPEPEQPASEPKPYNVKPKRGRMPILPSKPNATSDPEPEQPASDPKPGNVKSERGRRCNEREKVKGEWDAIRCLVCLDHPHDSIHLVCSSHSKGCRAHVCDPGYHRPNCFDVFCEIKHLLRPSKLLSDGGRRTAHELVPQKVSCPLCKGEVFGWIIEQKARGYMNQVVRTCALDSCDFRGDYIDLRVHARIVHGFKDEDEYC